MYLISFWAPSNTYPLFILCLSLSILSLFFRWSSYEVPMRFLWSSYGDKGQLVGTSMGNKGQLGFYSYELWVISDKFFFTDNNKNKKTTETIRRLYITLIDSNMRSTRCQQNRSYLCRWSSSKWSVLTVFVWFDGAKVQQKMHICKKSEEYLQKKID